MSKTLRPTSRLRSARSTGATLRRFVVFLVICTLTAVVSVATAQRSGKKPAGGAGKKPPTTQPEGGKPEGPKPESKAADLREGGAPSTTAAAGGGAGGATETRTGDGGVKSFRFEEVAIEGRLQSPELVYFLRRVRAEFNAGDLGHRSFTGELSDTKRDPNLR